MTTALRLILGTLTIATVAAFQSCDKIKDSIPAQDVSFDGASADIVIPATSDTTAQGQLGDSYFSYNLDSLIQDKTSGSLGFSNIQSVKVNSVEITLSDANQTNNFANFSYASFTFNTDANNGSYGPYTLASIESNPDVYSADLQPPVLDAGQDVKKYFSSKTTFHYAFIAKLRRKTTKDLHAHLAVKYTINVKA